MSDANPRPVQGHLEAFRASGTSPTLSDGHAPEHARARDRILTLHLLGPGKVGRALLEALPDWVRLVGVTDSAATLTDPAGLDPLSVARHKADGGTVRELGGAVPCGVDDALDASPAAVVVDATATCFERKGWAEALERRVLGRDRALVLAAKDALCRNAHRWVAGEPGDARRGGHPSRAGTPGGPLGGSLGLNAVLGGTGALLQDEIGRLRDGWDEVAVAGNASTTAIVQAVESGGTVEDGIRAADRLGLLEADPELDLRGVDAAVKLAIVAGALLGRPVDPGSIPAEDVRNLDAAAVQEAARTGRTTRLVGRARPDGSLRLGYEALDRGSPLAVPRDRVAYGYRTGDRWRWHLGDGLGPAATARAVLTDLHRLADRPVDRPAGSGAPGATGGAGAAGRPEVEA